MISAAEFEKWLQVFGITGGGGPVTFPITMGQGGTGANLTPANGSLFYSTATEGALLPTANNGVLVTNGSGIPSISSTLPSGLTIPGYGAGSVNVTSSATLTSPAPSVVRVSFTTPGQTITLPHATLPNGQPAGRLIYFEIAPTNTQLFDVLLADGSSFIVNAGTTDFAVAYSTNGNDNGTPISIFDFPTFSGFGTMAFQNASSVTITGGSINGVTIGNSTPAAGSFTDVNGTSLTIETSIVGGMVQGSVVNDSPAANSSAGMFVGVADETAGDAIYSTFINGGDLWTWGLDNSDGNAWVLSNTNALGSGNALRIGQDLSVLFYGSVTLHQDATTGLQAVSYQQLTSSPNISGTTHTLASSDALRNNLVTNAAGCTITVDSGSLQTGESAFFQRAAGAGNITFAPGTGTIQSVPAGTLVVATQNGAAWIFKGQDGNYYLRGDLTT